MNPSKNRLQSADKAARSVLALSLVWLLANHEAAAQNFWQQTNGPYGGTIQVFAINPTTQDIFAGTDGGGVFRSTNNGDNWIAVNTGLTNPFVLALAINASGHIFAGTRGGGVFRSTNNGDSWTAVNTDLTNTDVYALAINASGHIFAGTGGRVFRSTNNGDSWTAVNTGLTNPSVSALAINASGHIFAENNGEVFRSTNNGESWTAVNTGLTNIFVTALAINASGHIFAGTPSGEVFRSTNNGDSWTAVNTGLTTTFVYALAINASGHIFAGTRGDGVFRSTNNGDSWTAINTGLTNPSVRALAINSSGHIFAGTFGGGVFRSTNNGDSWAAGNAGLTNTDVYALAINSSGHIFAGTFGGGVFRSTNNGDSWTGVNTGLTNTTVHAFVINTSGHIFAGTFGGGVFRSTNNGDSWAAGNAGLTNTDVYALAINSSGHIFAGTFGGGVFRSTNNGDSWTAVNTDLTNTDVYALAINTSGHIFAGTGGGVFRSTNNGDSWTAVNTGLTNPSVRALAINSSGHIFASTAGSVFRSTINGDSWTAVNTGLTNTDVRDLAINASGHIFASTAGGVFRSTNNGDSWTAVNTGLTNTIVFTLAINASGFIFAGTFRGGVFRSVETTGTTPMATTNSATNITATSATLNGSVTPNKLSTTVKFEFGTTTTYGSEIAATPSSVSGASAAAVSAMLTGLIPNTLYHYRVVGTNSAGTTNGADQTFLSLPVAPTVTTNAAVNVSATSATLNALVNPNNDTTDVKFEYGTDLNYGKEVTATPSPVQGTNNVAVSADVAGLVPNTLYHFRAVGINSGGTTRGTDQTFTTSGLAPAVITNAATNISSASATLNATLNPNNATAVVKFEYGIPISYGSEVSATPSPVSDANAIPVSAMVTGLVPNTLYHYRVVAINNFGTSNGSDQTFVTSTNQAPLVTATSLPPQPSGQAIQVQATVTDDRPGVNATVNYRRGGDSDIGTVPMTSNGNLFVGTIPLGSVTSRGVEFFIVATDVDNVQTRQPNNGYFIIQIQVTSETKPTPQPSGIGPTAHRLISVPLQMDNPSATAALEDDLGPYDNTEWRLFGLDPTAAQDPSNKRPFVEFSSGGDLSPGKSLFLIVADPGKTITIGAAKSVRTDKEFSIPLQRGHNFIGTPFNFTIPAGKLRLKSGGSVTLRTFNGSGYPTVTEMQPWEGYYIANLNQTSDTLLVNPDLSASAITKATTGGWRLRILASCAEARDDYNFAGVATESEDSYDDNDLAEPPPIGDYVSLYFPHPEWQKALIRFSDDIRAAANPNHQWRFNVATNITNEIVTLRFDGLKDIDPAVAVVLIDEELKYKQNLRENAVYQYQGRGLERPKEMTLIVGNGDFVAEQTAATQGVPEDFVLEQNFPNPFGRETRFGASGSSETAIRFGLPTKSLVTIKIFDLAGHEVATLLDHAELLAGRHQRVWGGLDAQNRPVSNGIYFCQFVAGSFLKTIKMVVVR